MTQASTTPLSSALGHQPPGLPLNMGAGYSTMNHPSLFITPDSTYPCNNYHEFVSRLQFRLIGYTMLRKPGIDIGLAPPRFQPPPWSTGEARGSRQTRQASIEEEKLSCSTINHLPISIPITYLSTFGSTLR